MIEPIRPFVGRRTSRNTALSVSAFRIASGKYQACPPRVVRATALNDGQSRHLNQIVRLARWRKLASFTAQLVTLRL
jgi:hypothetical protein